MRFPLAFLTVSAALAAAWALQAVPPATAAAARACPQHRVTSSYAGSVLRALRAKRDVWGNDLIGRPNGPTYAAARRLLKPLLYARGWKKSLTTSGLYYLPFAQPLGVRGATTVALHVADGSEILSQTATGPRLTVFVGRYGLERYGSCLSRLGPAKLAQGYLPVLLTKYVDRAGTRYLQESFSVRGLGTGSLVSFLRLTVEAGSARGAVVRFVTTRPRLMPGRPRTSGRRSARCTRPCAFGSRPESRERCTWAGSPTRREATPCRSTNGPMRPAASD